MLDMCGLDMRISQGDTAVIHIVLENEQTLENALAVVTLKRNVGDRICLWEKRIEVENNQIELPLTKADTNLPARMYWWDIRLIMGDAVQTPFGTHRFEVVEAIGDV